MKNIARGLLVLVGGFFLITGLGLIFNPMRLMTGLLISTDDIVGLSNIRGLFGGAISAIGISVLLAAKSANINEARPAVLFMFMIIVGRIAGLVFDGFNTSAALYMIMPIIMLVVLIIAHKLLDRAMDLDD